MLTSRWMMKRSLRSRRLQETESNRQREAAL